MCDIGGGASVWRIPGRIPGRRGNEHSTSNVERSTSNSG